MPIKETPGGLGNAGYISGKAVEREQARLAREACQTPGTYTIDMPGALADVLDDLADAEDIAVRGAYAHSVRIPRGRGHSLRFTAGASVLASITSRADFIVSVGTDGDYTRAQVAAARVWIERYEALGI